MKELADLGAWFSFGTGLLDPVRKKLREALRAAPPWKLLFETEAPESGSGPQGTAGVVRPRPRRWGPPRKPWAG